MSDDFRGAGCSCAGLFNFFNYFFLPFHMVNKVLSVWSSDVDSRVAVEVSVSVATDVISDVIQVLPVS